MTTEKDVLSRYAKKENPFRTPEGYFDRFAGQLMAQLPEVTVAPEGTRPEQKKRVHRLHPIWLAAAIVCGVICCTTVTLMAVRRASQPATVAAQSAPAPAYSYPEYSEEELFEAMDYALVDNNDISMYLSEAY